MLRSLLFWITLPIITVLLASTVCVLFLWDGALLTCSKLWGQALCLAAGVTVKRSNRAPLPTGPAVYIINHSSDWDIFALAMNLPPRTRGVAKRELGWIPFFGWALRLSGMILVDRANHSRALRQMEEAAKKVHDGRPIFMAPEGTRSKTGELLPFKKGAFVLAIRAQVPIVPIVIKGAYEVQSKHSFRINPGVITMEFLEPIPTGGLTLDDRDALIAKVRGIYLHELGPLALARPAS